MTPPPIPKEPAALFLDFDGTLVALADTPADVVVPERLSWLLGRLNGRLDGALAFVTGRSIEDLDGLLNGPKYAAVGVHGGEWRDADSAIEAHPGDPFDDAREAIAAFTSGDDRLVMERKSGGVTVHYRRAPERRDEAEDAMRAAFDGHADFEILAGHMMWEARRKGVDKGAGIDRLMDRPPFAGRTPIFIGDDTTDEDGFRAVNALEGVSIKVGDGDTAATARLADIDAVYAYLQRLALPGEHA